MPERKSLIILHWLLLSAFLPTVAASASSPFVLLPDSSNFVKASVVVALPGSRFYSNLGHVAIRMECPLHELDYCFSFMADDSTLGVVDFFAGKSEGRIFAIPTAEYLAPYRKEGRGVEQWELNLTLHEKQRLWMLLDEDMVDEGMRKFNFVQSNCTSMTLIMLSASLIEGDRETFVWPEVAQDCDNATGLRFITRHNQWMQFLCLTLFGTEGEKTWHNAYRMCPELILPLLQASTIDNNGASRPFLTGCHQTLSELTLAPAACRLTPTVCFGGLLLLVCLLSLAECKLGWRRAAQVMDALLLAAVSVAGSLLLYITLAAGLFGVHWNWFLIPLSPLPAVVWMALRNYNIKERARVYALYAAVLVAFIAFGATLSVFTLPHLLMVATLALRCAAKWQGLKQKLTNKNDK